MNADELANDLAFKHIAGDDSGAYRVQLQDMLRQQANLLTEMQKLGEEAKTIILQQVSRIKMLEEECKALREQVK